jgi:hypothetical protein
LTHEERDTLMPFMNSVIYGGCCWYISGRFWVAVIIAVVTIFCATWDYGGGRRALYTAGFALLLFTICIAIGLFPNPHDWKLFS